MVKKIWVYLLFILSAAWSIGISLRFLLLTEIKTYTPNLLDQVFDWAPMFTLGCLLLIYAINLFVKEVKLCAEKKLT
jgi:hypothetical protein